LGKNYKNIDFFGPILTKAVEKHSKYRVLIQDWAAEISFWAAGWLLLI
jgi:hypothetical protein